MEIPRLDPDERRLITWAPRAGLVLWDAENIKRIRTLREADVQSTRPIFAISPDSRSVLLAGTTPERGLELQSLDSGELLWSSAVKSAKPLSWVQFSDDGLYAVGKDSGGGLHVWNARTGHYVWEPSMPKPYAEELLEERRAEIAAGKPRLDRLTVDISGYLLLLSHVRPDGKILSYPLADPASSGPTDFFSPDGKRYVSRNWWDTGSDCDETVLWDIASAKPLRVFSEDAGRLDVFAFTGDEPPQGCRPNRLDRDPGAHGPQLLGGGPLASVLADRRFPDRQEHPDQRGDEEHLSDGALESHGPNRR